MNENNTSPMNIIVTGDVTMDWNLARTSLSWQCGGVALLSNLVSQTIV